jgi:hypothetical protein
MKSAASRKAQVKPDQEPEYKSNERPGLTIAEKASSQTF